MKAAWMFNIFVIYTVLSLHILCIIYIMVMVMVNQCRI